MGFNDTPLSLYSSSRDAYRRELQKMEQTALAEQALARQNAPINQFYMGQGSQGAGYTPAPQQKVQYDMIHTLKRSDVAQMDLETLLACSMFAKSLTAEYAERGFEVPEWLPKRQRELERGIAQKLEDEMARLDAEAKELEDKATKREAILAQREKLAKLVKG